ncbi:MAG: DoxX family protein [Acidimicrobiales bacterium]
MFLITVAMAAVLSPLLAFGGVGRMLRWPMMEQNRERLGLSQQLWTIIGVLELAAAGGVLLGLWVPALGLAAAAGVVALMIGALIVHLRNGDDVAGWAPPLVVAAMAIAYIVTRSLTL